MYFHRAIEPLLQEALKQFPICILTGARQVGKSTLLKNSFSAYRYVTLDDPLMRTLAINDPQLFLDRFSAPVIIDEIQYAPTLMSYIKIRVDSNRHSYGQYILTGSQVFSLMKGVTETLAGRAAIFELYPPSWNEIALLPQKIDAHNPNTMAEQIVKGFYPEFFVTMQLDAATWYSSYLTTYIERDVRQIINITDLHRFQTFMSLLATRAGQLFNASEIAKECGISVPTVQSWISVLEATYVVRLVQPYFKNISKRMVKSPKLFFIDTGLLCYLLGIDTAERFFKSSERGHVFENMVVIDCLKQLHQQTNRFEIFFYRTSNGVEADLMVEKKGFLHAFEIKLSSTPNVSMADALVAIQKDIPLTHSAVLSIAHERVPLRQGIDGIHWSELSTILKTP